MQVREITFQNGEELTEEGLPFLILFHKKEDTESLELYQKVIARNLIDQKCKCFRYSYWTDQCYVLMNFEYRLRNLIAMTSSSAKVLVITQGPIHCMMCHSVMFLSSHA